MNNEQERRSHQRFKVLSGVFALNSRFGQVVDISLGGISFRYINRGEWSTGDAENGALFGEDDLCVDNIPLQTVSDEVSSGGVSTDETTVRRRSLKFGPLTRQQKNLLEHFIWVNTAGDTNARAEV